MSEGGEDAAPPIPVLTGEPDTPATVHPHPGDWRYAPDVVRYALAANLLGTALAAGVLPLGYLLDGMITPGAAVSYLLFGALAVLLVKQAVLLRKGDMKAWHDQRRIAWASLLLLPPVALLNVFILLRWREPQVQAWFTPREISW
jgi:hypothetical protein